MAFDLLNHQMEGIEFLTGRGSGLLAFEQGLGKTLVAIEAFRRLLESGRAEQAPRGLSELAEAELGGRVREVRAARLGRGSRGPAAGRRTAFGRSRARVVVTSYETARAETAALIALCQRQRTALVLDESHAAKNWKSQTSAAMRAAPYSAFRCCSRGRR